MNRSEIIEKMYADPDVAEAIGKMEPEWLRDDLRQEIFLVLCEQTDEKLSEMARDGWLKWFIVRTMLNMIKSDRSTFWYKFRRQFDEVQEGMAKVTEPTDEVERDAERVRDGVDGLHWYEAKLIEIYAANGQNIAKISRETGIPYRSLFKTIKKVKGKLKREVREERSPPSVARVRMTLEVTIEVTPGDTDTVLDTIDTMDEAARMMLPSACRLMEYKGFKIKTI
jgi:DNA-directed RNA polymerase specialized sigma24 family protein